MGKRKFTATLLFVLVYRFSLAQLSIFSPVNNQVMQRDQSGEANIPVTAYTHSAYTEVKALLKPIGGPAQQTLEWAVPQEQLSAGFIHLILRASSGWYQLQLIGRTALGHTDSVQIARVGVGEVFLVAGNSNAMGLPDLGAQDASENVVSFNKTNKILNTENITVAPNEPIPVPAFDVLKKDNFIFPSGETAWYWGQLGDLLSARWNCPILFYNAAWAAANSENYRDAATGKDAFNLYIGKNWPNRQPYSNIVNTMRYLASQTGARAVLWSHGENDAQLGFTEESYFNNIQTLIQNTRTDTGFTIPWLVARNSVSQLLPNPYLPVVNAQNQLTEVGGFDVFKGPDLDTIQVPRPPSGHFESLPGGVPGLTHAAQAWERTLTNGFIQNTNPALPENILHTGVTPGQTYPGSTFDLPYQRSSGDNQIIVQAELLDQSGNFVDTVGTGNEGNVQINLPAELRKGVYRIRLTSLGRTTPGSISDSFYVDRNLVYVDFVNKITARSEGEQIRISWLTAAVRNAGQFTLQKSTDGASFSDVETFTNNPGQSQVLSYLDPDATAGAAFYRIKIHYNSGAESYSRIAPFFRNGGPPELTVFPNPVTNSYFYVRTLTEKVVRCDLFDAAGRAHPIGYSDREIEGLTIVRPTYDLPTGVYILKLTYADGARSARVIFK